MPCQRICLQRCVLAVVWSHLPHACERITDHETGGHPPFAQSALWASSLAPSACDTNEDVGQTVSSDVNHCSWSKLPATWRYIWNNLRLAVETSGLSGQILGAPWVHEVLIGMHSFIEELGDDADLWSRNWRRASTLAREMIHRLQPILSEKALVSGPVLLLPRGNHGFRFPLRGRSVNVPTNGDVGVPVTLANGIEMPLLGIGTAELKADTYQVVRWALEMGYQHIDTAQVDGNEEAVGNAIRDSGLPRKSLFVATKLSDLSEYATGAQKRFRKQLESLGLDYIDAYMLHSPGKDLAARKAAWRDLEDLYNDGLIRALGVCSFDIDELEELFSFAKVKPVYLQSKISIYEPGSDREARQQRSIMEWASAHDLIVGGHSMIQPAHLSYYLEPLDDPHVVAISRRLRRTPSQVLHRWALQLGSAVIPRSSVRQHISENTKVFDFMLAESDMRLLNGLSSLAGDTPSYPTPPWREDVYGVRQFPGKQ